MACPVLTWRGQAYKWSVKGLKIMGTPNTREFDEVLRSLCSPWREELDRLEPGKKAMVSELRFRTGCPVSLTIRGEPWFMDQQGLLQKAPVRTARRPTQPEMDELVAALCDYSVHTHAQEIREGHTWDMG